MAGKKPNPFEKKGDDKKKSGKKGKMCPKCKKDMADCKCKH